jgi:hypothetical protein
MNSAGSLGLVRPFFSLFFNIFGSRVNDHNLGFCSFFKKICMISIFFLLKKMIGPQRCTSHPSNNDRLLGFASGF